MSTRVQVRVPATSANLGPGYDCAGLALALYDELSAELLETSALEIVVTGEGADTVPLDDSHLVVRSMARGFQEAGLELPGLRLTCHNRIPHGRGLGSSSAAIVGGLALARELVSDGQRLLADARMLEIATELEGHPDNVAPAIFGGLTIAWTSSDQEAGSGTGMGAAREKGRVEVARFVPNSQIQPVVAVPSQPLATEQARGLLPATVPHPVAAANGARTALLVPALTTNLDLLMRATHDVLHQDFRRFAYPQAHALMTELRSEGIPSMISGAGPTVIALGVAGTSLDRTAVAALVGAQVAQHPDLAAAEFEVVGVEVDVVGAVALGER